MAMTRLVALYWNSGHGPRQRELDIAVERNIANPDIDEVVLLVAPGFTDVPHTSPKVKVLQVSTDRPQYREILSVANNLITSPNDKTILVNTDCYFEHGDLAKLNGLDTRQFVISVSRRDLDSDLSPVRNFCVCESGRDAWIYTGRIRPMKWLEFTPGCPKCDWYLCWQNQHAGYALLNLHEDIKLWHIHASRRRNYGPAVAPDAYLNVGFIKEIPLTRLTDVEFPKTTQTGILSYSLFGNNELYTHGAMVNAEMARYIYPGFIPRFYVDDSVHDEVIRRLKELLCEIVVMPRSNGTTGARWRLKALEDKSVDYVCIRDVDSRLSLRDRAMFDAWVKDGRTNYHIVRDHPDHKNAVILCYFDSRKPLALPDDRGVGNQYGSDERYFAERVVPLLGDSIAVHDTASSGPSLPGVRLPSPPWSSDWNLYVGAKVWPDSGIDPSTAVKLSRRTPGFTSGA